MEEHMQGRDIGATQPTHDFDLETRPNQLPRKSK